MIGLPGDEVSYLNKKLAINGKLVPVEALPDFLEEDSMRYSKQFEEQMDLSKGGTKKHMRFNCFNIDSA